MKTVNVSESALDSIKSMAIEREKEIEILRESIKAIRDIAAIQEYSREFTRVQTLCNEALCE
jgi:hypothetical protein